MSPTPQFSIVVPVYNVEKILPIFHRLMASILQQSISDWELIVVNDASTDNTADILQAYVEQDSRIRIITHKVNLLMGLGRKHATDIAIGEYVVYCDYDDYLDPAGLESARALARRYHSPDIIQFPVKIMKNGFDADKMAAWNPRYWWKKKDKYYAGAEVFRAFLSNQILGLSWGRAVKTSLARKVPILKELPEDLPHTLRLCAQARTVVFSRARFYFHLGRSESYGLTMNKRSQLSDYQRSFDRSLAVMSKLHTRELFYSDYNEYCTNWLTTCSGILNEFEHSDADLRVWGRMADAISFNFWGGVRFLSCFLLRGNTTKFRHYLKLFRLSLAHNKAYQRLKANDAKATLTGAQIQAPTDKHSTS